MRKKSRRLKFRIIDPNASASNPKPTLVDLSVSQVRRISHHFSSTGRRLILVFGIVLLLMLLLSIACDHIFGK
jgi:hypothetical protein